MLEITRTTLASAATLALLISGCTAIADGVRPEQQSA